MKELSDEYVGMSLSWGTMREEDLIPELMQFLQHVKVRCEIEDAVDALQKEVNELKMVEYEGYSGPYYENPEDSSFLLNEDIWDLLNDIAPKFTYFGSSEGDGADYGFWTSTEALEEYVFTELNDISNGLEIDLENVRIRLEELTDTIHAHGF